MENPYSQVYGLTGVMGSGKSTVAELFRAEGASVLDADEIARYVIDPAAPYYPDLRAKISSAFGQLSSSPLFKADGSLDRPLLSKLAFSDAAHVARMNAIMHPAIQREFSVRVARATPGKPILYDVPLLFEGGLDKAVKATILVYAGEEVCVERAVKRARAKGENLSPDAVRARLRAQISIEKKRSLADYIIDNSGDLEALKPQVAGLYQKLASL